MRFEPEKARGRVLPALLVCIAAVLLLMMASGVSVKREMRWIDAVSGSVKSQTRWVVGLETKPCIERSALDEWIRSREGGISYDWRLIKGTWENLWGRTMGTGHGGAPPIYSLHDDVLDRSILDWYVEIASDEKIAALVDSLRHGTEAEQEAGVVQVLDEVLAALDARE